MEPLNETRSEEKEKVVIREIQKQDNKQVEALIRFCLMEYGANKPGCAWEDPDLGRFYELYQPENRCYWVAEEQGRILAGCGIGPVEKAPEVCELQKMYSYPEARGKGIGKQLLKLSLEFARKHYRKCYLETFRNMKEANAFYQKQGFRALNGPIIETEHYACDAWYIKEL